MGLSALGAGLSGMKAYSSALDQEGHNIANLNTPGFKASTPAFSESSPAGSGVTLSAAGRRMAWAEGLGDMASSITNGMLYKVGFDLSAQLIKAADERLGTLIDIEA